MEVLYYLLVVAYISGAKGYGDAAFETAKMPWDLWHIVTRAALCLACVWPWLFALPGVWVVVPGAVMGTVGFAVGKRLGGKRWPSLWVGLLKGLFTRKA